MKCSARAVFSCLAGTALISIVAYLLSNLTVSMPTNADLGVALFGVNTVISASPTYVTLNDRIKVNLVMTNKTATDVRFRYIACIECHIDLIDLNDTEVFRRDGAPILESPYEEVLIRAGETVEKTEAFRLGDYYSVPPGVYSLRFKYFNRLMEDSKSTEPWTLWSKKKQKITIKS